MLIPFRQIPAKQEFIRIINERTNCLRFYGKGAEMKFRLKKLFGIMSCLTAAVPVCCGSACAFAESAVTEGVSAVAPAAKVTFGQAIRDNPEQDVGILIAFLAIIAVCLYIQYRKLEKRAEREQRTSSYIVQLATNYECVDYIDIRDNKLEDTITEHHIVSEKIGNLIPEWKNENHLSRRISLLMNELVFKDDRVDFWKSTRREEIFRSFEEGRIHVVNFRVVMNGDLLYYQERFTPVRDNTGKIIGMISGIMDAGESKIAEPF